MGKIQRIVGRVKQDKSLINKLLYTSLTRGISAIGTFVFNFVLAKYLGATDLGYFMLAYSILIGLGFLVRFGMSSAILRFVGVMYAEQEYGKIKKLRSDVLKFSLLTSSVLGVLLILLRSYISDNFFGHSEVSNILLVFAFALPFYSYLILQSSFLKAYKRPELAPFFEVGLTTFITGTAIAVLAWYGLHVNGLITSIVFLFSSVFIVFLGYLVLSNLIKKEEKEVQYELEDYSGFFPSLPDYALSEITGYLLKFSPTIILGMYVSGKDIGLYSLANSSAYVINFVLWIVSSVYAPHFASFHSQGRIQELKGLVVSSTFYMLTIAIPIFLVIITFSSFILGFFGDEFKEAKNALIIMAVAQLFNVATGPVYFLLNMTGQERHLRNIVLLTALISIASSFILIPYYGYMGAAIATAIGLIVQNSLAFSLSSKYLGINFFKKKN
jgi:O-antigen/teichoic acid export membrane protein